MADSFDKLIDALTADGAATVADDGTIKVRADSWAPVARAARHDNILLQLVDASHDTLSVLRRPWEFKTAETTGPALWCQMD